jgi:hypothetical protein
MNKSVPACPAEVWYAICTMPLFVFCWAYFSSWVSAFEHTRTNDPVRKSTAHISQSVSFPAPTIAAYFPFIVPPARCSRGTRTGCGACFIQKGVHFHEPAPSATNYDPHELCRTSSETKIVLSRLPNVRFTPVPFFHLIGWKQPFIGHFKFSKQRRLTNRLYSAMPNRFLNKIQGTMPSPPVLTELTANVLNQQSNHFTRHFSMGIPSPDYR